MHTTKRDIVIGKSEVVRLCFCIVAGMMNGKQRAREYDKRKMEKESNKDG